MFQGLVVKESVTHDVDLDGMKIARATSKPEPSGLIVGPVRHASHACSQEEERPQKAVVESSVIARLARQYIDSRNRRSPEIPGERVRRQCQIA